MPLVIGMTVDAAKARLASQPLGTEVIGVPAKVGKRPGYVVKQEPRGTFLSANGIVRVSRDPPRSTVRAAAEPRRLQRQVARARLRNLKLKPQITFGKGIPGTVLEQTPDPGVAAGPGLRGQAGRRPLTPSSSPATT